MGLPGHGIRGFWTRGFRAWGLGITRVCGMGSRRFLGTLADEQ